MIQHEYAKHKNKVCQNVVFFQKALMKLNINRNKNKQAKCPESRDRQGLWSFSRKRWGHRGGETNDSKKRGVPAPIMFSSFSKLTSPKVLGKSIKILMIIKSKPLATLHHLKA